MLLMAVLCQLAYEPVVLPTSPSAGAIVLEDDSPRNSLWVPLGGPKASQWNPITAVRAIEDDPGLKALWTMPVARVNDEIVTVQDVLHRREANLLEARDLMAPEQFAAYVREYLIAENLPRAVGDIALWMAVREDYPQDLFEDSRQRHEQTWQERMHPTAQQRLERGRDQLAQPEPESWKRCWVRDRVVRDYLVWKFAPERMAESGQLAEIPVSERKKQVREFRQQILKRAKVETPFAIQWAGAATPGRRLVPGEKVDPSPRMKSPSERGT